MDSTAASAQMALSIISGRDSQFYWFSAVAAKVHRHMPLGLVFSIIIQ
jgi:hypothetical protein